MIAKQGHAYEWKGMRVISLESGEFPRVCLVHPSWEWMSVPMNVDAKELTALPMKYFHGEVPK